MAEYYSDYALKSFDTFNYVLLKVKKKEHLFLLFTFFFAEFYLATVLANWNADSISRARDQVAAYGSIERQMILAFTRSYLSRTVRRDGSIRLGAGGP